jgi:hypothetical protein
MIENRMPLARRLTTPRGAAVAGILFAVLTITALVLVRVSIPPDPVDGGEWLKHAGTVSLALGLFSFAGIAFLWFIGVVRDRLGELEDRFFSTVFLGSGLLFLAMTFVSVAVVASMLTTYDLMPTQMIESGVYAFGRQVMYQVINVYATRMAAVFMMSLGTVWVRSRTMPRLLALLTFGVALFLLVSTSLNPWMSLVFPGWVLVISIHILVTNLRRKGAAAEVSPATVTE